MFCSICSVHVLGDTLAVRTFRSYVSSCVVFATMAATLMLTWFRMSGFYGFLPVSSELLYWHNKTQKGVNLWCWNSNKMQWKCRLEGPLWWFKQDEVPFRVPKSWLTVAQLKGHKLKTKHEINHKICDCVSQVLILDSKKIMSHFPASKFTCNLHVITLAKHWYCVNICLRFLFTVQL